jgi:hypothetical protein
VRIDVCVILPDLTGPASRHDGIGLEWFRDEAHLERFEDWLDTAGGRGATRALDEVAEPAASPVLVADEAVMRGDDWLRGHRGTGRTAYAHLALARRAEHLTPGEFSRRWRDHAGQLASAGSDRPVPIPARLRGLAYVQNHPRPRAAGEWAYDGLNEVYFDDVDALRERSRWFRESLAGGPGADFVRQSWFLAVRQERVA